MNNGVLYVVSTPIGNLKDITIHALEILENVDYILCEDTRVSGKLLNHYKIKNKLISFNKDNENIKTPKIIDDLLNKKSIALISDAGTPILSDPGFILIKKCKENSIKINPLPGASALLSALVKSHINTPNFMFHGFLSKKINNRKKYLENLVNIYTTHILYVSKHEVLKIINELAMIFPKKDIALHSELTKLNERELFFNLSQHKEKVNDIILKGEFTLFLYNLEDKENINIDKVKEMAIELSNKVGKKQASKEIANKYGVKSNYVYKLMLSDKNEN